MNILYDIEKIQIIKNQFNYKTGDKICINFKILDEKIKKKSYNFEGYIISIKNKGLNSTCTVRKISYNEGVEKTFFIYSPTINFFKLIKKGNFKKSKLYYLKHKKQKFMN